MTLFITKNLRPFVAVLSLSTLLFGFAYPGLIALVAETLFPSKSHGQILRNPEGAVLGSEWIGQEFSDPKYFWGRLSATAPYPYNAASSGASNLGVNHPALHAAVQARVKALKEADSKNILPIPVDLVTSSASGLDPHISPSAADYQISRVAKARHMDEKEVRALVKQFTLDRDFGIWGEPRVHLLKLNLALDRKI